MTEGHSPLSQYGMDLTLPFKISAAPSRRGWKYERDGHWNEKERLKYAIFLTYFSKLFQDPIKKKSVRIYDMMSDMIITRNSNQCRSHHQKMEKYRTTIPDIIASVAEKYQPRVYKEIEQKYLVLIKMLLENGDKYTRDLTSSNKQKPVPLPTARPKTAERTRLITIEPVPFPIVQNDHKKDKQDKIRTAESYDAVDGENNESVPVMALEDRISEEEGPANPIPPQNMQNVCFYPSTSYNDLFSMERGLQLTMEGRSYYQQQIKLLEQKRQWHIQNSQLLSAQLINEKQSIQHCDAALKLYQLALSTPISTPTIVSPVSAN